MAFFVLIYKIYLHEEFMHAGIIYFYHYIWGILCTDKYSLCCVSVPLVTVILQSGCDFFYLKKLHSKNVLYFGNLSAVMKAIIMYKIKLNILLSVF